MKIINAIWEKNNLGLDVCEIHYEKNDGIFELKNALNKVKNSEYVIVNIPVNKIQLMITLNEEGFLFIETKILLSLNILSDENGFFEKYKKFSEGYSCKLIKESTGFDRVISEIEKGIFTTDKYAIDPFVGINKSNNRYCNWLRNISNQHKCYIYEIYDDHETPIGFFSYYLMDKEDIAFGFLGGLYKECTHAGYGFLIDIMYYKVLKENGIRKMHTGVSSNNLEIVKLHVLSGYNIDNMYYVYRKIN